MLPARVTVLFESSHNQHRTPEHPGAVWSDEPTASGIGSPESTRISGGRRLGRCGRGGLRHINHTDPIGPGMTGRYDARFARGEIDEAEYRHRLEVLRNHHHQVPVAQQRS